MLGGGICVTCSLIFNSSVTPADLLAASMAAEPFPSTYLQAGIGGLENSFFLYSDFYLSIKVLIFKESISISLTVETVLHLS